MIPEYFETHFLLERPLENWPDEFAIITAFAPTGTQWTDEQNQIADQELEAELNRRSLWKHRLTGYSPVTGHAEPGWAVATDFESACDIGQCWQQDAIYFVWLDKLSVSHCDHRRRPVHVGGFRERLHLRMDEQRSDELPT
jgi:hypothetical protein